MKVANNNIGDAHSLPQGYKQTEIGVIPEDWEVKEIDQILTFGSGQDYKHLKKGEVPVYGTGGVMTYVNSHLYEGESVGIGRKGTIDKPVFLSGRFWTVDTLFYTHSFINVIPRLIFFTFLTIPWKEYNEASGVPSLNKNTLGRIKIALPPTLTEQKAIATALSDVDALISSLDQLITKKKAIKQGAMQELLTPPVEGGKRLPGFDGEWEEKKLEEILKIVTDYTANGSFASLKENVTYYSEVNYAVLVRTTDLGKKNFEPKRFTDRTGYDFLEKTNLFGDEIIMANVGSVGKVFKVPKFNMPMTLAPNTYLLKFHDFIDNQYMYLWMKTKEFVNKLMSKVGSTTLLAINKDNLRDIDICMPIDIEEQKAIAQILSDMDLEIEQLEAKKAKYEQIKQGMMQELLTGKIRFI